MDPRAIASSHPFSAIAGFWARVGASITDSVVLWPVTIPTSFIIGYGSAGWAIAWILLASPVPWLYNAYCHGRWGKTIGKHAARIRVVRDDDEGPIGYRQAFLRDSGTIVLSLIAVAMMVQLIVAGETDAFRVDMTRYEYTVDESQGTPGFFEVMGDVYGDAFGGYSPWMIALLFVQSAWFLVEITTMLTNPRRRALHDYIGGTVVVAAPFRAATPTAPGPSAPDPAVSTTPRRPSGGW